MIPNIQLNETSPVIAVLHKMMQLLNLTVDAKERSEQRAGKQTQNVIRDFQKQNQLPFDEQFVVDKPTINYMLDLVGQRGYLDNSMRRKIKGKVQMENGKALHRIPVAAIDLDLPAVSKYKDLKTTKELIALREHIEFLGLAETDQKGYYEITFYDWMYEKSERRSADVVVYALERGKGEPGEGIVGHSALFQNVGYDTGEVNILIAEVPGTSGEYKPMLREALRYLQENQMGLDDISDNQEQISFVASELDIELEKVQHIVQANTLNYSIQENLEPELLYGLARQKIALDLDSLHRASIDVLETALAQAMEEKDIDTFLKAEIDAFIDALKTVTAAKMLEPTANEPNVSNELLALSLASQNERISFVKTSSQYKGTDEKEFWEKYLPEQTGFKVETIKSLRQNQKLFLLSGAHLPLVTTLAQTDIKELPELVTWDLAKWVEVAKKTGVPAYIKGKNEDEKFKNYATDLRNTINKEYPKAAVQHKITTNQITLDDEVRQLVNQFLNSAQDFDIKRSKLKDFKDSIDAVSGDYGAATMRELKELQRLVRINPDTAHIQALKNKKLTSASTISEIPQKTFIKQHAEDLGGRENALKILNVSKKIRAAVNIVETRVWTAFDRFTPSMITSSEDRAEMDALMSEHWPGYSDVFNVNVCECGHCNSVYGPAAYFVDLMRFLGLGFSDENDPNNPQKVFKDRRPDLFHLPLTCENSNTLIPYIDLANEVMENYIYYTNNDATAADFEEYQSADTGELTEEELRVQPQNIRKETYFILAQSIFPFSLPFHLPLEILYTYSNQLGTSWYEVLEKTNDTSDNIVQGNLNAAYLHLSENEYAILTGKKFDPATEYTVPALHSVYGVTEASDIASELIKVLTFLKQTGIAYTDLVQLLYTNFINPYLYNLEYLNLLIKESDVLGASIYNNLNTLSENDGEGNIATEILDSVLDFGSITEPEFRVWITTNFENIKEVLTLYHPTSACDLENTQLKTLKSVYDSSEIALPENILVRMHKFIRLWRKTGWSIQELDALLSALGNVDIDTEMIKQLSFAKQFIDETGITPKETALLWGIFDYHRPNNLYAKLFLKKSFKVNEVFIPIPGKNLFENLPEVEQTLSNYTSDITAAFKISETTLNVILKHLELTVAGPLSLSLENLSAIYRYILFAKSCDISVQELVHYINVFGLIPFENPEMSIAALAKIEKVESTDFTLETLGYIFNVSEIDFTKVGLKDEEIKKQGEMLQVQHSTIDNLEVAIEEGSTEADTKLQLKRGITYQQLGDFLSVPATLIKELVETEIDILVAANGSDFNGLFATLINKLHKAVATINGFSLEQYEVDHFLARPTDFSELDFNNMQVEIWWRLYDYVTLKEQLPTTEFSLIDIFNYDPTVEEPIPENLSKAIQMVTQWSKNDIEFLLGLYNPLVDFKNEIVLNQMANVVSLAKQMGVTVQTLYSLGKVVVPVDEDEAPAEEDEAFNTLLGKAQKIKNVVKARYNESDWITVATKLNDKLRELQRDALVAHLLNTELIKDHPMEIKDANGLYEFFLIDVQMSSCMDTSRIVQASAAIQQFVNRVHLNLEDGVPPDELDRNRWEWMKYYRVWEAQMRVLYENYTLLKPEWRQDASPFFDELVSHLTQNDITDRTAEEAMRGYLKSMSEVANLNVAGSYQENYKDKDGNLKFKCLHVFGHTNHTPYTYYYRTWNEFGKWSAWEKVDAAIQPVVNTEDDGKPGVHLIPVVWKNRLLLFWPEFMQKTQKVETGSSKTFEALAKDNTVASQTPKIYWEVRLAWSEYYDKKWTAKQVSEDFFIVNEITRGRRLKLEEISFSINADEDLNALEIYMVPLVLDNLDDSTSKYPGYGTFKHTSFKIRNISNQINIAITEQKAFELTGDTLTDFFIALLYSGFPLSKIYENKLLLSYKYNFQKTSKIQQSLRFDHLYLSNSIEHQLLFPNQLKFNDDPKTYPFFYSADDKTYFVKSKMVSQDLSLYHFGVRIGREFVIYNAGLEFHTFHHPFVSDFISNLNKNGIGTHDSEKPGLMESDILAKTENGKLYDDAGVSFINTFGPILEYFFRPPNLTDPQKTYYKEIIDFDPLGANSKYNWELFFHAPLHIATELSKNGKFKESIQWFHYIFDPTTDEVAAEGFEEISRFWKVKPFKTAPVDKFETFIKGLLVSGGEEDPIIKEWRDSPFNPHLVASNFPDNYMKYTVLMYVQTLVDWGDSLYRKFTREDVNEAIQLYVIASHILGPKPPFVPKRGTIKKETFKTIRPKLTNLNAWVELENSLIYSSDDSSAEPGTDSSSLLGTGLSYYFCIPPNEKLLQYWETVEDRLFKIRHCKDINGVTRRLALFAPRIDPEALIKAKSAGLDLSDILTNLNTPAPHYRFSYLLQKANEFCNDVKGLGAALLSAIEKEDGEALSRLRSTHEIEMLQMIQKIKERQIIDAEMTIKQLIKQRETAEYRFAYYNETLLGNEHVTIPTLNELDPVLTDINQIIINPPIPEREINVNVGLVDSNEEGVKIISKESEDLSRRKKAMILSTISSAINNLSAPLNLIPSISAEIEPFGVGASASFGGSNLSSFAQAQASYLQIMSSINSQKAAMASTTASYIRREQEWTHQANLVAKEIGQVERQILSAGIRLQMTEKELENHKKQIENANATEIYLKEKFTNKELYMWMKDQLKSLHKQSYDLAFNMAKMAEKAFEFERGPLAEGSEYIEHVYWDNSKYGLLAGEKLQLAIRQMDKAFHEVNTRQFELTKHISLKQINPIELIRLRETGTCDFKLTEEIFDLDYPGHYNRRIKSVSLSIPCVVGPYTTIPCTLRLSSSQVRVTPDLTDDALQERSIPLSVMATSSAQQDSGVFELNFRDERYVPFEGAGVLSTWNIELFSNKEADDFGKALRQFDYSTISDVIIHLRYTAEYDGELKNAALAHLNDYFEDTSGESSPSFKIFDLKRDFSSEWHKFFHADEGTDENVMTLKISKNFFPYRDKFQDLHIKELTMIAESVETRTGYNATLIVPEVDPIEINLVSGVLGNLLSGSTTDIPIVLDSSEETRWSLRINSDGENLNENELKDMFIILGYTRV